MNLKLFYSPPKWFAFIAPARCEDNCENLLTCRSILPIFRCSEYDKAYAEAKANALEVGNPSICPQNMSQVEPGKVYDWPYKSEIKDGKYILSL